MRLYLSNWKNSLNEYCKMQLLDPMFETYKDLFMQKIEFFKETIQKFSVIFKIL